MGDPIRAFLGPLDVNRGLREMTDFPPDVSTCGALAKYLLTLPPDLPTFLVRSDGSAFRLRWQEVGLASVREADTIQEGVKGKGKKAVAFCWPLGLPVGKLEGR